jgi:cysteine desulfurase
MITAMKPIYLDYNATTPLDPSVFEAMLPYLKGDFGNPSSTHVYGALAKKAVHKAREQVALLINCNPDEIVFTSGGSESNNFAIKGAVFALADKGKHLITTSIEHPSVLEVFRWLGRFGFQTTILPVDNFGLVSIKDLEAALTEKTILLSIMHANNEVGTIEPIEGISQITRQKEILFHTDSSQTAGKIETDVKKMGVDLLTVAGHKLYAPKGIGALYVKRGIKLDRFIHGAGHEHGMRAGTENVPYIVALGKACEIATRNLSENSENMKKRRDELHKGLLKSFPTILLNGHPELRLPNTLSLSFPGINANTLLSELTEIAASPGAACHADSEEVSYVLKAMGLAQERGYNAVRFSTGKNSTQEEIEEAVRVIGESLKGLKRETRTETETQTQSEWESKQPKMIMFDMNSRKKTVDMESEAKDEKRIKLTRYTQGLGCACKIRPQVLEEILRKLPKPADNKIIVGTETRDDAAVYKLNDDLAIVETVDFFTPIVDDPYRFGEIAVANSLSDIYAMGAKPLFGLNIVAFPTKRLPIRILGDILAGAESKSKEAGISIIGGHTVEDDEPKYGLAVTGIVNPKKVLRNSTAKPGDVLILTKPIGSGIISTAVKRGVAGKREEEAIYRVMAALNSKASEIMLEFGANACTDITGFGLLGHMLELVQGSKVDIELFLRNVPIIEGTRGFVEMGIYPGGTLANLDFIKDGVIWQGDVVEPDKIILADAQTSGGLLISVGPEKGEKLIKRLHDSGIVDAAIIGKVTAKGPGKIII